MQFMEIEKKAESITYGLHRLRDAMPYEVVNISYDADTGFMNAQDPHDRIAHHEKGYRKHIR